MQRSSGCFSTLFYALAFFFLYPLVSLAALTVQIKTVPEQAVLPLEVEFEAVVSGGTAPYSYVWSFGDGGTSALVKDSHYYREDGEYTVRLTVFDALDGFGFVSKTITVSSSIFDPENAVYTIYSDTTEITSMIQDNRDSDILWVGTRGGLVRLNIGTGEKKFYLKEIPGLYIRCLIQSSDGAIWIGTDNGLVRFVYEKDQWTIFNTGNSRLPDNHIYSLLSTFDGAVWSGTWYGLVRLDYEKDQWAVFDTDNSRLPDGSIHALLQTSDGAVWVGAWHGLARFDYGKDQWTVFDTYNSGLPDRSILSLLQTFDGAVWVGTRAGGFVRFDYGKDQWTVFDTDNSDLPNVSILSLLQTSDSAVWAGTQEGLARFDYDKNQWTVFNTDNSGLPHNSIYSLLQISNGAVWAGTLEGLIRFDYSKDQWIVIDTNNSGMSSNSIDSLLQTSDGAVWMDAGKLTRFDYGTDHWTIFNIDNSGLPLNINMLQKTSDDAVWVGAYDYGLARFDYGTDQWTVFNTDNSGLPDNNIYSLLQTSDDAVWVGTWHGIARFDYSKDQWTVFNKDNSGLPHNTTNSLLQTSDGAVWVGTWYGLVRFDYSKNQWTVFDMDNSGLPDHRIYGIQEASDGAVWIVTLYNLARFDYEKDQWTVFNAENSVLINKRIWSFLLTSDDAVWLGISGGLARFDYTKDQWAVFNSANSGLASDSIIWSLLQTSDDSLWVGGYGLTRISFPPSTQSPGHMILLAGGGAARTNPLWPTTMELATSAYRIFNARGFKNTDIYFMSPEKWADFNGDGYDDHIVDCPRPDEDRNITKADLEYAITDRAVKAYTPGTPLFLYIIDHGYSDDGIHGPYFMISPGEILYANELSTMLSTYETATGGQVIVINESCYSGEFMSRLKKQGRIVITSASNHIVNYDNFGNSSFTHHFLRYLFENNSLQQAFSKSLRRLQESNLTFYQTPQLDDNGDGKYDTNDGMLASAIKLGGDFATGSPWPQITALEKTELSGTSATFTLTANAHMKRVWATVQPPDYVPDMSGNYQNIELEFFNLSDPDDNMTYTATYENFAKPGRYILTFYAKDQFGNVAASEPVNIYTDSSPADVNGDGKTDLADAILALKICTGQDMTGQNISAGADINNNQKIGLEEAVYILRKVSGQ